MYQEKIIAFNSKSIALTKSLFTRVYAWMFAGLLMSALMAFFVSTQPALVKLFLQNKFMFFGLIIGEFLLVILISGMINRISSATAGAFFAAYSLMNGITLSVIFLIYQIGTISLAFGITAVTFGLMSLIGYFTKADLSKLGSILFMGLVGIILASIVNIFLKSNFFDWIISMFGVLIFVGLTAYDTNKIKMMLNRADSDETIAKIAVLGALSLYLDFINLFLFILRLIGRRR
ncbi:MAG TPA: Bax inhibitor-1/YccA family protein [Victivallales bacterium]|nr:Bax inhibitor-1/YccA family protein [Victivallales bacterium]HPO90339.1 Bax inhibitor-1/YccA family protein [Victivallales bacterium]HRR05867.1 Bax inhibitor-1/YccA family protein [Victivallales bacterium]HRR29438.1 Bax inhibitor-1/YccA family protein [Victivallales bacterium]HRU01789.1 Bax inhibitor-1/YccA family protein [Victivallales bacterium]